MQDPYSDFRKNVQETVKLFGTTVKDVDPTSWEIFDVVTKGKPHHLQARTEMVQMMRVMDLSIPDTSQEKRQWMTAINESIEACNDGLYSVSCLSVFS